MMRRLALPVLLFLAAPACNGNVVVDSSSGAASSGSGSGQGGSSSSVVVGVGVTSGVGGSSGEGGSSGVGGAPSCKETHDTLSVLLSSWQGKTYECGNGSGDFEFSAAVVDTPGPGLFVLDSCSPAADCIPFISKLSITAPSLATDVPKGTYVKVHVAIDLFMGGCSQRVQITNLSKWDGAPNPVMSGDFIWFLGVESSLNAFPETPFMAFAEPLGCFPNEPSGCGPHEDYQWRFQIPTSSSDPGVVVQMGDTAYWGASFPTGFEYLSVHNLRSLSSGACDGPLDFAYWAKHEYPLD